MTELEVRAGEELERKMDRYARLRLDPSAAQAKRARSALMEAAWRERLATPLAPAAASIASTPEARRARGPFAGWGARRIGASFAAAVLAGLLVGTAAFATSRAGGPLYATRVALEELTLPTDPQARLKAELALAQGRVSEIADAVAKDDPGAVAAAVQAYLAALDDLDESTGGQADSARVAVQFHQVVLEGLLATVPENARAGIENAIERSSAVIGRLDAAGTPQPNGAGAGPGAGAGGNGAGTGVGPNGGGSNGTGSNGTGANGTGTDGQGGKPSDPGAKPSKDPKPAKTAAPAGNERPAKTPAPVASLPPAPDATGGRP